MSKKNKKQKRKNYSGISQHTLIGKTLVPPFAKVPKMKLVSWMNDRMPEMLWAALLLHELGRVKAIRLFRDVIKYFFDLEQKTIYPDITLTGISRLPPNHRDNIFKIISSNVEQRKALLPLMLFDKLPLRDEWKKVLKYQDTTIDESPLFSSVAEVLDHQSQYSTDCRWLKVACLLANGYLHVPTIDMAKEIFYYPNFGEQEKVRPSIRALEGIDYDDLPISPNPKSSWKDDFWEESLTKSNCFPLFDSTDYKFYKISQEELTKIYSHIIDHFFITLRTTEINPKHDTVFGTVLFSMNMIIEITFNKIPILERNALRTIFESYITLAYLLKNDNVELWKSHRVYGAGQAKLSFLKLDDLSEKPKYIDIEYLKHIVNEDVWQEYISINLGHWENSNLRKMSEQIGLKDEYDKYYNWTSSYTHGNWGAIRDSVFVTCGNPLHRFHRIPSLVPRQESVLPDAISIFNKILELLDNTFPSFTERLETINTA